MITQYLFPAEPRDFPQRRNLQTLLRALHILAGGVLLGGHIFHQPDPLLIPWLWFAVGTGAALMATDLYASFSILLEMRGLIIIIKLLLLIVAAIYPAMITLALITIIMIGGISSHMPGSFRHRVLFLKGRFTSDCRSG